MSDSGKVLLVVAATGLAVAACGGARSEPAAATPGTGAVLLGDAPPVQALPAMDVEPATGPAAPAVNPFAGAEFYVDPIYTRQVESTPTDDPQVRAMLERARRIPTGLWLDTIGALEHLPGWLEDAQRQSEAQGRPVVPVVVLYDLPNRDCAAKASAGELKVELDGERRYRTDYIDPIVEQFRAYPNLRIAVVLEPDSLANLATNLGVEKCARSQDIYKRSTAYAIAQLSLPHVFLYLDAAHAGWLGWNSNRTRMADVFREVLDLAGGQDRIRGFATNVSNYNALDGNWGKQLEASNPCPNELAYVQALARTLQERGIAGKGFLVDTGRNGQRESRQTWGSWCNVARAGLGERPQASPAPLVDAYFWIKPPGESDGIADPAAARFDSMCGGLDAMPGAPEAKQWFPEHFVQMMERANPPL